MTLLRSPPACIVTCAVVVENLCEYGWMTVKEVLIQHTVIVALCLGQTSQSRGGNLPQCGR